MYRPEDHIKSHLGLHWYRNAGAWADQTILESPLSQLDGLIIKEEYIEDGCIDPRDIVGTSHARYNSGMTWREFLHGGKRIGGNLAELEKSSAYYDDPKAVSGNHDTWHVVEIDGKLYSSSSNHRSVIAKFRAHEQLVTKQKIHSLKRYTTNRNAQYQYEKLQEVYLPGQRDFGTEKKLISDDGRTQTYITVVQCHLEARNPPVVELPLAVAASSVAEKNRAFRLLYRLHPKLWDVIR
jgi:hypothetical protein